MTCIAVSVKHGVLAADTRCSADGVMFGVSKVRRIGKRVLAAAGDWDYVLKFWELIKGKSNKEIGLHDEANLEAIELNEDGIFLYSGAGKRYRINDEFFAIGSGAPYAIGAMAMGATPEEAVALAARFDPATGGAIEVFPLKAVRNAKPNSQRRRVY